MRGLLPGPFSGRQAPLDRPPLKPRHPARPWVLCQPPNG